MILDGNVVLEALIPKLKSELRDAHPKLAIIRVGENPASLIYVKAKRAACERVGIQTLSIELPEEINQARLHEEIESLNRDAGITGILLQLPLPKHLDPLKGVALIHPQKDIDGLSPTNMGKLLLGDPSGLVPCTALGISMLLEHYEIPVSGKHVVIVGRSNIVGKPLAALWVQKNPHANATVTLAHSMTSHLDALCESADILVVAIGHPGHIHKVKKGACLIDVGINPMGMLKNGKRKVCGDVDFESLQKQAGHITPVPGGVGPMTIGALLTNMVRAHKAKV